MQIEMGSAFWGFVWVASILIGAVVGNQKGQGISGFILALLLGPLGALIVLLSGASNRIKCPNCAEPIRKEAKICPHCKLPVKAENPA